MNSLVSDKLEELQKIGNVCAETLPRVRMCDKPEGFTVDVAGWFTADNRKLGRQCP